VAVARYAHSTAGKLLPSHTDANFFNTSHDRVQHPSVSRLLFDSDLPHLFGVSLNRQFFEPMTPRVDQLLIQSWQRSNVEAAAWQQGPLFERTRRRCVSQLA
jgi:hypothetical protein